MEVKKTAYEGNRINVSCFEIKRQLPDLKKDRLWLNEINSQSLQQSIINLDAAFTRFFKGYSSFPNFKKKSATQSFQIPQNVFLTDKRLIIPKFKEGIDIILHRQIKGKIRQATISRTSTGKYFVSILCETGEAVKTPKPIKEKTTIGIDLGIKSFLVASDGQVFDNPKFLKHLLSKLKFTHRKYSKKKGKRAQYKLAKLHEKVANQRKDFLHKISTRLIRENQSIAIEDLHVAGMVKNHKLAQAINDCGWSMFVDMLKYKAEWHGVNILEIGAFEPSSKTCSTCGSVNKALRLQDREWTCKCEAKHDRDVNASINIKTFALKSYLSGTDRENRNELPTLVGVLTSEA